MSLEVRTIGTGERPAYLRGNPKIVLGSTRSTSSSTSFEALARYRELPNYVIDTASNSVYVYSEYPDEYFCYYVLVVDGGDLSSVAASLYDICGMCDVLEQIEDQPNLGTEVHRRRYRRTDFFNVEGIVSTLVDPKDSEWGHIDHDDYANIVKHFSEAEETETLFEDVGEEVTDETEAAEEEAVEEEEDDSNEFSRTAKLGSQARYIPYLRELLGLAPGAVLDQEMLDLVAFLQAEWELENTTGEIDEETYDRIVEQYGEPDES